MTNLSITVGICFNLMLMVWVYEDTHNLAASFIFGMAIFTILLYLSRIRWILSKDNNDKLKVELLAAHLKEHYTKSVLTAIKLSSMLILVALAYRQHWVVFGVDLVSNIISYSVIHYLLDKKFD